MRPVRCVAAPVAVLAVLAAVAGCTSGATAARRSAASGVRPRAVGAGRPIVSATASAASPAPSTPVTTHPVRRSSAPARPHATHPVRTPRSTHPASTHAPAGAAALPVAYPTGDAQQVITVAAGATSDRQATVQAWQRSGSRWVQVGAPVTGWLGSAGMTEHPDEGLSATPMGSFTLTEAFGHDPDPGTALPYRQTTPADWWISQPGPLYNTLQHCTAQCPFTQGDPNEHLYDETPYYDYAMVIDYNTGNAGPVRQGAGSAFFVHVSVGSPTQGCVSLPVDRLVALMRWLRPADHPRILIGLG